jgi:hypothetical protein
VFDRDLEEAVPAESGIWPTRSAIMSSVRPGMAQVRYWSAGGRSRLRRRAGAHVLPHPVGAGLDGPAPETGRRAGPRAESITSRGQLIGDPRHSQPFCTSTCTTRPGSPGGLTGTRAPAATSTGMSTIASRTSRTPAARSTAPRRRWPGGCLRGVDAAGGHCWPPGTTGPPAPPCRRPSSAVRRIPAWTRLRSAMTVVKRSS